MESIAVTKPRMGVLSQERLALSPFGALAQSFVEELAARTGQEEGQWPYVPLELLREEEEGSPAPLAQTVLQVDLKLVLDGLRKAQPNAEYLRATERIVERILQRREIQREVTGLAPADRAAPFTAPVPQSISQLQQHIFQTLNQMVSIQLPEKSHPGNILRQLTGTPSAETGRPGQLGQRAKRFSHTLRILREEGKSFPAQPAANQQVAPLSTAPGPAPGVYEAPLALEHVAEQEDAAVEAARQGSVQAATQLLRTTERLERMIQTEATTRVGEKPIQASQTAPIAQNIGPNQEYHLPPAPVSRAEPSGSLHKPEISAAAEQREMSRRIETAAKRIAAQTRQAEQQEQNQQTQLVEQERYTTARDIRTVQSKEIMESSPVPLPAEAVLGMELTHREAEGQEQQQDVITRALEKGRQTTARDIRTVQPEQGSQSSQVQLPAEAVPGVELTHRETEEQGQRQEPTPRALEKGRRTVARDIRTAPPEQGGASHPAQVPAEAVPSVELTHREAEPELRQLQPRPSEGMQGVELNRGREKPSAAPHDRTGIVDRKNTQKMSPITVLNGDIRVARRLTGRGGLSAVDGEEEQPAAATVSGLTLDYTGGQQGETEEKTFPSSADRRRETADRPVELAYGPSQPAVEQTPVQPGQSLGGQRQEESDYVRSLPDWARNFLRESWASPPQEMGVARNISTQPVGRDETIQWTAPNYQPAPQLTHREKQQEERHQKPQQIRLSEAEIQRAADKVYRIIEDRIREERIRFGF